ncbi:MAG TPA: Re/Si-specific NAD(P)(+) transhydrogenase subunit alpha [Acidimicrobiales bacterium]|nr:Re/Si-specific NAD(P)(+) transhydrogenase subunit alpha [Acidimicrobiales bacterium]
MKLAVPTETRAGERRVALIPDVAGRLAGSGVEVVVQQGAGVEAHFPDAVYVEKGATVAAGAPGTVSGAALVTKVQAPTPQEVQELAEGTTVVSFFQPASQLDTVRALVARKATAFSLDLVPRISRAQSMDALSSQATVSGYLSALAAAERLPKFFPMFMTAAGTVPPAKVLVLGAGVAGLQAIATARRLGAQVRAFDVRAAAKEEVQSLGATFVELELESQEGSGGYARVQSEEFLARQRELISNEVAVSDVVITTAAVPGRQAPVLVTTPMVERMVEGSVIVDMAADSGGNCELSEPGKDIEHHGVVVCGLSNPPSAMPTHASFLYSRNVANFLALIVVDGELRPDFDDEIVVGSCVVRAGEIVHAPTAELLSGAADPAGAPKEPAS